jgi:DsrE/DsrF-like family
MTTTSPSQEHRNDFAATVLLLTREGMGHAEPELQHKVLRTFLTLLFEGDQLPRAICFYTDGVKLVTEGSPVLDLLQALEARRVPLIVCQTCLNHFQLAEKLKVGLVGGMGDIIAAQAKAAKVITL